GTAAAGGTNVAVAPAGRPVVPNVIVPAYPLLAVLLTVGAVLPVPHTGSVAGLARSAKSARRCGRSTKSPPVCVPLMPETMTLPLAKNGDTPQEAVKLGPVFSGTM